jgi:hypothetical protein
MPAATWAEVKLEKDMVIPLSGKKIHTLYTPFNVQS